ncbi:MAG: glycosyltransferase [Planctomycetaceae bacterium]|nr:glycosyltransferase [Planctomycetaceae bacterium]
MPKRVCFIIDKWHGRAGVELQLLLLTQYLDRSRIEPYIVVLHGRKEYIPGDPQCPFFFLDAGWLRSFRAFHTAIRLRRFLKRNKIEIIQALNTDNAWLTFIALASLCCGVKAVFGFRVNIGYWMNRKQALLGKILNRFFIKRIIANARACQKSVIEQEGAKAENIDIVANIIEIQRFAGIPVWKEADSRQLKRIGIVGNLKPIKGTDVFIDAAKIVLEKFSDVQFNLAGEGDAAYYQSQIDAYGIGNNVKLLGSVSDIPAFLASLDIAVLSSRTEGLPNAVMEYMAAGRPCVVTDVGGCGELIHNEHNGLLVPSDNPPLLAAAIGGLLEHPDRAERFAAAARNSIKEDYDAKHLADRWCEIYEKALQ